MKLRKHIVVVPVVEAKLDLLTFGESKYTWVSFWDDLRDLHDKCILHEFKIFVDQLDPASSPPKLFICTLISAQKEEAYSEGINSVRRLCNSLVCLFSKGFEPRYHEAVVVPFPCELPPTIEDTISVELVELTIKNGTIEEIRTPYFVWKPKVGLPGKAVHEQYLTTYFKIPKIEPGIFHMPTIYMVPKEVLQNIESNLRKVTAHESSDETALMDVITTLYSAAITVGNVSISYLLLWQILESLASSKDEDRQLLTGNTVNRIQELLQREGYDADRVHRVNSQLGMLKKKSDTQIIAELLRQYLSPNEDIEVLKKDVEEFRKIRGAITHPRTRVLDANKLYESYKKLRETAHQLLQKLRYAAGCT